MLNGIFFSGYSALQVAEFEFTPEHIDIKLAFNTSTSAKDMIIIVIVELKTKMNEVNEASR